MSNLPTLHPIIITWMMIDLPTELEQPRVLFGLAWTKSNPVTNIVMEGDCNQGLLEIVAISNQLVTNSHQLVNIGDQLGPISDQFVTNSNNW
jgi:hypothetical protein